MIKINAVTIRNANIPSLVNKFLKEFARCKVASLIDFFSRYDQMELDKRYKDMTIMITLQRLVR